MSKKTLTTLEAAAKLGVKPSRMRQLLLAGRIPGAVKFGRDWAIPEKGLAAVAERKRTGRPKTSK